MPGGRRERWLITVFVILAHASAFALFNHEAPQPAIIPASAISVALIEAPVASPAQSETPPAPEPEAQPPVQPPPEPEPEPPPPEPPKPTPKPEPPKPQPKPRPPEPRPQPKPVPKPVATETAPAIASNTAPAAAQQSASASPATAPVVGNPTISAPVTSARHDAAYLNNPKPAYPALSKRRREEGKVLLRVFVTADGTAGEVQLHRSSGFDRLDRSAQEAVTRWRFVPAKKGSEAIGSWYIVPIDFKLIG